MTSLREYLFWKQDALKGHPIKKHLSNIESLFKLEFDQLIKQNEPLLNNLLALSTSKSEFYKQYRGYQRLQDFPIVNKNIIKQHFDAFNIKDRGNRKKFSVSTSGSTGTPFKIYQSKEKKHRNTADTIFFAKKSGFTIGDRLLYLRLWAAYYKKPQILAWMQNIDQLDVEEINDDFLNSFFEKLIGDKQRKGWLAYPSALLKVCNFLDANNYAPLDCNITSIIAMSEPLDEYTKEKTEYYFKCPVVSRYSNVENGIIAQQAKGNSEFDVNWASYHVEVLAMDSDNPATLGEPGRIVITDLYNLATPIIRYDTGDVATLTIGEKGFPKFSNVQGRITDILTNTKNEIVNPFIIYNNLYRYPELDQVQLVQQKDNVYVFKINSQDEFRRETEFISFFKPYLGDDANILIEYVSEIPLLKSGKRKIIVNET